VAGPSGTGPCPIPRGTALVRWTRRTASAVLAVTTALALTAPAATAAPTTTTDPAQAAAGWLATQLVDGERIEVTFDFGEGPQTFADQGLTADVVFALAAAGVAASHVEDATDWLESQVGAYTGTAWGDVYAGSVGKLLLVAAVTDRSATDFGDADLVALLEDREQATGRYSDQTDGDWTNTITQSLGVLGLHRTPDAAPSSEAVDYLAGQLCDGGGFPGQLDPETCTGDIDATGFAVQALLPFADTDAAIADTVETAVAWLVDVQADDGSFGGTESPANANSTGLAAAALRAAGASTATDAARGFLLALQDDCAAPEPGAIRFDAADAGDPIRATAQAVVGLLPVGLADVTAADASDDVPSFDCPFRFPDVDYGSTHARAIDALARQEIMGGRTDGTFAPAAELTRAQLASIVARAAGLPPATGDRFSDVEGSTHEGAIYALAEEGILDGYQDGTFRPSVAVQRDQAAAILARWLELAPVEVDAFSDIAGTTHRRRINALAGIDVALGTADGRYLPGRTIRRDQAASLLSRTLQHLEAETVSR
jgi:hypothetical protein